MDRARVISAVRRPESAAIAGLAFAGLLGASLVLLHGAAPTSSDDAGAWLVDEARRGEIQVAVTLLPFAGISFLWFIAVIRLHLGAREDRFFETVFIGSGLVFVASLFTAGAALKAILSMVSVGEAPSPEVASFAWSFASAVLGVFGAKMAAVFAFSAATAGLRARTLPRWLALLGYVTGLTLLVIPPLPSQVQFLLPAWVALVSLLILVRRRHSPGTA